MDIFSLLTVLGGVALFLYGMRVMGNGLEKLSGGKLEKFLERVTSSRLLGVLLGAAVTAVLQSSSATTVTVVGFVNAGIMKLSQAVGIIMGANVGTTVTGWILTLSTLPGNSIWEDIFRATTFTPVIAVIGILFIMAGKKDRQKDVGTIMLGFAVLMFAMHSISEAVSPLREDPVFTRAIGFFSNPLLGILVGIVITTVLQSSSASVGILQALSVTGSITYGTALPVIMGMNIGASVPALLSSMGAKVEAKRAAFIYLYFNVLGTVICLPLYYLLDYIFSRTAVGGIGAAAATSVGIALVNTVIKVVATLILLPFSNLLCKLEASAAASFWRNASSKPPASPSSRAAARRPTWRTKPARLCSSPWNAWTNSTGIRTRRSNGWRTRWTSTRTSSAPIWSSFPAPT